MHRPEEVERLFVAPDGGCDQDPVDLVGVDDPGDLGGGADHRLRQPRVLLALGAEEADDLEPVLRMRLDLPVDQQRLVAAADDERAARLHHAREDPASDRATRDGDQDQRDPEEDEGLGRGVHPPVEEVVDTLREEQVAKRADEHRVEEVSRLVEARDRDLEAVVVVELVRGEDRQPDERRRHGDEREEPRRARDGRQRRDPVGDQIGDRVGDREHREIAEREDARASPPQPVLPRRRRRRANCRIRSSAHLPRLPSRAAIGGLIPPCAHTLGASGRGSKTRIEKPAKRPTRALRTARTARSFSSRVSACPAGSRSH